MNNETMQISLDGIAPSEALIVLRETPITEDSKNLITNSFVGFFLEAKLWKEKADQLIVTDVNDLENMKLAREARLALVKVRTAADKKRKELKAETNNFNNAVQGIYKVIEDTLTPIEKHLEMQENFKKRADEAAIMQLEHDRIVKLAPYAEFVPVGISLGLISEDDFIKVFDGAMLQSEAKNKRVEDAIKQAKAQKEADELHTARMSTIDSVTFRQFFPIEARTTNLGLISENDWQDLVNRTNENENFYKEKQLEIQKENERLRVEAEKVKEQKDKLEAERKSMQDKIDAQKKEIQQRIDDDNRKKKLLEEKQALEEKDRKAKARKLKNAPDKQKIIDYITHLAHFIAPPMKTTDGQLVISTITKELNEVFKTAITQANQL